MRFVGFALAFLLGSALVSAEDVFRIEVGRQSGSNEAELQRRVFYLERAVFQLQQRIFNLEGVARSGGGADSWLCTVTAMGEDYTGTGGSKAVASERAINHCKGARNGDSFFCKDPKCSNN